MSVKITDYEIKVGWKYIRMICKADLVNKKNHTALHDIVLEHHLKTGETFFIQGDEKVNISYGNKGVVPCTKQLSVFGQKFSSDDQYPVWNFLEKLFEKRGLKYITLEEFHQNKKNDLSNLNAALVFARFPVLQHLPFRKYSYIGEKVAKELDVCEKGTDVWKTFIGRSAKTVREWCDNDKKLIELMEWGKEFENTDALLLFVKNTKKADEGLFIGNNSYYYGHGEFQKIIEFGKTIYGSEYRVVEEMVKENGRNKRYASDFFNTLRDIERIYKLISNHEEKKEEKTKIPSNKSLKEIHDELSEKLHDITDGNVAIPYTEKELKLQEESDNYTFYLVKDTSELQNVGRKMHHCVYGYRDRVLSKRSMIVLLRENGRLQVCIELNNKRIVQAKSYSNKLPKENQRKMIEDWAKKKGLVIQTSDLTA